MDEFESRLLTMLVFERHRLSRNRNFHAFDDPTVDRLRRIAAHLRQIVRRLGREHDLDVQASRIEGRIRLVLVTQHPAVTQQAWLDEGEWEVLRSSDTLRPRLDAALPPAPSDDSAPDPAH